MGHLHLFFSFLNFASLKTWAVTVLVILPAAARGGVDETRGRGSNGGRHITSMTIRLARMKRHLALHAEQRHATLLLSLHIAVFFLRPISS